MVKISPIVWTQVNRYSDFSKKTVSNANSAQKTDKLGFGNNISFAATNPIADTFTKSTKVPVVVAVAQDNAQQVYLEAVDIVQNVQALYKNILEEAKIYGQNVRAIAEYVKDEVEPLYAKNSEVPANENIKIKNLATGIIVMEEYPDGKNLSRKSYFNDGKLAYVEEIVKQETESEPISKNVFVYQDGGLAKYFEGRQNSGDVEKIDKIAVFDKNGKLSEYQEDVEISGTTTKAAKSAAFIDGKLSEYREGYKTSKEDTEADKRIKFIDGKLNAYEEKYAESSDGVRKAEKILDFGFGNGIGYYIEGYELSKDGMKTSKKIKYDGEEIVSYQEDIKYSNRTLSKALELKYSNGEVTEYTCASPESNLEKTYTLKDGKWIEKKPVNS